MPPIDLYVRSWCGYCVAAQRLLDAKGAAYRTIDVEAVPGALAEMKARAGGRTSTPQIFVGETHVGGCDDLHALERAGGLDPLLRG